MGKPKLIESDDGKNFVTNLFNDFLNKIKTKRYSRITFRGAAFAERLSRTIRDLYRKTVFEAGDGNW